MRSFALVHPPDAGPSPPILARLLNQEMLVGKGRDLRQVRNAHHLLPLGQRLQLSSHRLRRPASNPDIDLVEHQHSRRWECPRLFIAHLLSPAPAPCPGHKALLHRHFQRQHHPAHLPTRRNLLERLQRLARVGRDQALDPVPPVRRPVRQLPLRRHRHSELHLHCQIVDLRRRQLLQPRRRRAPCRRQSLCRRPVNRRVHCLLSLQLLHQRVAVLHLGQPSRRILAKAHHLDQRLPILPLQPIQRRQPVLDVPQPLRRRVHLARELTRLRAYVLHHCLGRRKLLHRLRKLRLVPRQLLHMLQRRAQRHLRRPLRLIQQIVRAHRRRVQFFRVGQHPLLRLQQRVLVLGIQLRLRNLARLKTPQIRHPQPVLL